VKWFGRQIGCLVKNCPYLHDRAAVMANRRAVLDKRRATFDYKHKPTPGQQRVRMNLLLDREAGLRENFQRRKELVDSGWISEQMKGDRAYCANPKCMKPWKEEEQNPLKACAGCKFAMYCSVSIESSDSTFFNNETFDSVTARNQTGKGTRQSHAHLLRN
jgi:hypothetical protein